MDHYISYFTKRNKEKAYRTYITDSLKAIAENTSKAYGGTYLTMRYIDIVEPKVEERTSDEIIDDIKEKLGRL